MHQRGAGGLLVNLLTFTITRYRRDFRKYLMRAAERFGGNALHVFFLDKIIHSWADAERFEFSTDCNPYGLQEIIRDRLKHGPILGLTGLGGTRLNQRATRKARSAFDGLWRMRYGVAGANIQSCWTRTSEAATRPPIISTTPRMSSIFRPSRQSTR